MLRFFARKLAKPSVSRQTLAKTLGIASLTLTISLANVAPSQAFFFLLDPNLEDDIEHFIECKQWLFSDPETHSANCLPSNYLNPPGAISTLAGGDNDGPPPVVETPKDPPPVVEAPKDPPPVDTCSDSCECDSSCSP